MHTGCAAAAIADRKSEAGTIHIQVWKFIFLLK
jgi:hypothetical protein